MGRRWSKNTYYWALRFLQLRDGEYCAICKRGPATQNNDDKRGSATRNNNTECGSATQNDLEIDHINGNPYDNAESNLRLLCTNCNVSAGNKKRRRIPGDQKRERERKNQRTRVVKEAVLYSEGSPEMQANGLFEMVYRNWLNAYIDENGFIPKKEAINAGAEVVGCNPTTAAKYLAKLTSIVGPLAEMKDMLGEMIIIPRNGDKDES